MLGFIYFCPDPAGVFLSSSSYQQLLAMMVVNRTWSACLNQGCVVCAHQGATAVWGLPGLRQLYDPQFLFTLDHAANAGLHLIVCCVM